MKWAVLNDTLKELRNIFREGKTEKYIIWSSGGKNMVNFIIGLETW